MSHSDQPPQAQAGPRMNRDEKHAKGRARRKQAHDLRAAGKTWKAVGQVLGVSGERARNMVAQHKWGEERRQVETDPLFRELARMEFPGLVRARNCLLAFGYGQKSYWSAIGGGAVVLGRRREDCGPMTLAALAAPGMARLLLKQKNSGKVTVRGIAQALANLGMIEDVDVWIRSET